VLTVKKQSQFDWLKMNRPVKNRLINQVQILQDEVVVYFHYVTYNLLVKSVPSFHQLLTYQSIRNMIVNEIQCHKLRHLFLKVLLLVAVAIKDMVSHNKFSIEIHLVMAAGTNRGSYEYNLLTKNIPGCTLCLRTNKGILSLSELTHVAKSYFIMR